jgi:hypothetical protein
VHGQRFTAETRYARPAATDCNARPTGHPKLIGDLKSANETIRVNVAARDAAHRGEKFPRHDAASDPGRQSRPVTAGRSRPATSGNEPPRAKGV